MPKFYYLPSATALRIETFNWARGTQMDDEPLAVEVLDYGVVGGVLITSFSAIRLQVRGITINREFAPSLCAGKQGAFAKLKFPRELGYGASFLAITTAPAAPDSIRVRCYSKRPAEIVIWTDRGDHVFYGGAGDQ